ncbi:DNA-binding response regulator [Saccharopolyspora rhizosphaerae]|uniref:DNA-binding response regulator n=1 Tax=Saccharopolyspora rhizosphaerae TaxID=2492662 RepID=A0A426K4L7_9PSEU|nr:response regulator transcription factor [Saccharopolyspora rhizosphaerae]RRO20437.1 DNA-binding response regulator [Saccharopolyspora rhizosphaerae]
MRATDVVGVLVVDDHAIVRRGLRAYLDSEPALKLLGEAVDGQDAVERLQQWRVTGARMPDVVLMDLQLPKMDGIEATRVVVRDHPEVKVVVLTSFGEAERVHAALAAGAAGYVLKDADPDEVATAIRAAATGEVHLDSAVARQLARRMAAPRTGLSSLTTREREILVLVAQGLCNREIAEHLVISERTARTHVSNLLGKLQLSSRTQAALLAIREGLVAPPT